MKPEDKVNVLFSKVYLPTFINKMAEAGAPITNEADLHEALKMATIIRSQVGAVEEQPVKASAFLKAAAAELEAAVAGDTTAQSVLADPEVAQALS